MHCINDLIFLFNRCFSDDYNTQLCRGGDEPLYCPATEARPYHAIFFAHGYYSSALHECAHWFIAGKERRQQVDFGYWYEPDGRTRDQQTLFQQVEIKPQAIEWILSDAAGFRFQVSIDNLTGEECDTTEFKRALHQQKAQYQESGLPPRAELFRRALCTFYGTPVL